jgi:hypothetical protein
MRLKEFDLKTNFAVVVDVVVVDFVICEVTNKRNKVVA